MNDETTTTAIEETQWEAFKKWQFPSPVKNFFIWFFIILTYAKFVALIFYPFAYYVAKHEKRDLYSVLYLISVFVLFPAALTVLSLLFGN